MSYHDFTEALNLAPECLYFTTIGGVSKNDIEAAEKLLGFDFSRQNKEFYEKFGYLSFFGCEVFGIDVNDMSILAGNSIAYALNERREYNMPIKWLPIIDFDDGVIGCLNYEMINSDGEPEVIEAYFDGEGYSKTRTIAEDFGQFLLEIINNQLATQ